MKRTALILLVTASIFPLPALAQDNLIRIIHDDGRVDEIEMPGAKNKKSEEAPEAVPPQDTATLPPASKDKPVTEDTAPVQAAPDPVEQAIEKAVRESDKEPAPKASAKPVKKKTVEAAKKAPPSEPVPDGVISQYPASPESIGRPMIEPEPRQIPPGTEITKEMALSIALDYAPPSRSVTVLPRTHEGIPVYVVSFRTDDGTQDFLIDRQTGEPIWADGSRGAQAKAEPPAEPKAKPKKKAKKKTKKVKPESKPKAEAKKAPVEKKEPEKSPEEKSKVEKTEQSPAVAPAPIQAPSAAQKPAVSNPVQQAIEKAVNEAEAKPKE